MAARAEVSDNRDQKDPHHHSHLPSLASGSLKKLTLVLSLTLLYMVAEIAGSWWTGSLALLADAGHMFTDSVALILAMAAIWFGARPATPSKTFGYYRLEILAALINGVALVVIALFIFSEAYQRWASPPEVKSFEMILIASGGLLINLFSAWILKEAHSEDLNVRGVWLHIIGDAMGSLGAITAGLLISFRGWNAADPFFSAVIGVLIIWSAIHLIRESTNVLLEGTPAHINLAAVEEIILETEGVDDVHDLHVWTITSGREALSAHVVHSEDVSIHDLLKVLRARLHDRFGIDHLTIQMETKDFEDEPFHFCHSGTACFRSRRN
jgi:cobalt-zinc-cadmium efflux system protein